MAKEKAVAEEVVETEVEQKAAFVLDNGEPTSRAGYIRQEFQKDRSRKEIAEELGVSYNIVFSATANMFNEAHPEGAKGGGRGASAEDPRDGVTKPRKQIMAELYAEGWTRAEIAAHFKCPYGSVFSATKDVELPEGAKAPGRGGKVFITDPETGEQIARVDFIRQKFEEGLSRREIANLAGCDYSVVWMATKTEKPEDVEDVEEEDEDAEEDEA